MKHFNLLKALLLAPLAVFVCNRASAQLSGTYTVGGTSPDYATLAAAVADLNANGVSGPVTFNIRNGSYTDNAVINGIAGASSTNRIVFKSETDNAANVTITNSASSTANNYVFKLNGAKWVTIRDLSLTTTNNIYCTAVDFAGSSSNDSLVDCILTGPNSTYTGYYGALVQSYNSSASKIVIKENTLQNGGSGVYIYGSSGSKRDAFVIDDNTISGMYYMPVYLGYTSNTKVRNNTITTTSKPYGYVVYNYYGYDAQEITGNTATLTGITYYYGLYNYNCIGSATDPAKRPLIANNNITVSGVSSSDYIAYNQYCSYTTFDNNNISISGATSTNYLYMLYYCTNTVVKNCTYTATVSSSMGNGYWFYQSHGSSLENNTFNLTSTGSSISVPYYYTNDFTIKNNTYNIQAASSAYGIYWPSLSGYYNGVISGNKINVTSNGSTVYGIYMST
jgi:parallel beta-helix repeat protein